MNWLFRIKKVNVEVGDKSVGTTILPLFPFSFLKKLETTYFLKTLQDEFIL